MAGVVGGSVSATSNGHRLWRSCARLVVVVGVVCATDAWGWQLALAGAISSGFVCVIVALPFTESTLAAMRVLYGRGALAGIVLVAASGLLVVGGLAGAVLVLMLAGSSPLVRDFLRARWPTVFATTAREPSDEPVPDVLPEPTDLSWKKDDLSELDDSSLCLAWRHTFVALQASRSPRHRLHVVRQREAILDELQRRCPAGFDAWLAAGARAPSNPLPFVRPQTSRAEDPPSAG